jgi:flagellar basal body P-ring protein FlgI
MVDNKTGHIIISDTIHIKRDDLQHDVLSLNIEQTHKQWDLGNGWSWIQEYNVFVENKYFIFWFGFFKKN